ncbi:Lachesin [Ooceraea biroi]|uniref:Lachesin n=1 Tax=Ooceraea biroi TaxID=2015173 RepID=A0A026X2K4_OOCBI|nr:Lachesin [Ooceraea biroi]
MYFIISGGAFQPEFSGPIANLTITLGRDATFTCHVKHLGGYRVGWVKADTKAIQAIHDHVITHNPRVAVTHSDHTMWNLHIKGVQIEDAGLYMCQINTDPMKSQTGLLSIVVPPDFISEATSSDVMVGEGGQVKLTCRARGIPPPRITWRREDGKDIIIREPFAGSAPNQKLQVSIVNEFFGEELKLMKISRNEMGVYLCIASNAIPPTISKRIFLSVHFPPVIQVPNQLLSAPLGTDVILECFVEAFPKSINYWVKDKGSMLISSFKHDVKVIEKSQFEIQMVLIIRYLQKSDMGTYRCAAKNSLGEVESSIRLYGEYTPRFPQLSNEVSREAHKEYLIRLLDGTHSKWMAGEERENCVIRAAYRFNARVHLRTIPISFSPTLFLYFISFVDNRNARD